MFTNIITGVVASAVFLIITLLIKQWLWPKYLAAIYKGTKIDGDWDVFYAGSSDSSAVITFKQTGTKIEGTSILRKNRAGETFDREYFYKGGFLNNSIVLTFEDKRHPLMLGGAMVFHHLDADAKTMQGKSIYFKPELNAIDTTDAMLRKK